MAKVHTISVLLSLTLPLIACTSNPTKQDYFLVESQPEGAQIAVSGILIGEAPIEVHRKEAFPTIVRSATKAYYGRLIASHPGCKSRVIPISGEVLENGIKIVLDCEKESSEMSPQQRLESLKRLRDKGLIDEEQYRQKQQVILDQM